MIRRGILSIVSFVFYFFGMFVFFILVGKVILLELCRDGTGWDDSISELFKVRWERWRGDLYLFLSFKISRCFKSEGFGESKIVELYYLLVNMFTVIVFILG